MVYYKKCLDAVEKNADDLLRIATIHEEMGIIYQQQDK